jgi:iron complex outermembrane recepter protein
MRKILRQTAIAAISSLLISSVHAADDGEPLVIIITPSGIEQPRREANTTITVIDQKTIENSNATSVSELLRGQAGLHVSDFFGDGGQATIDLRGFGPAASRNTLVLLDGRRLNNSADSASPDLSLIDVDDIAQIEILQGSGGVLYGNQAVGGVINIIRKSVDEDTASSNTRFGSFGSSKITTSLKKNTGRNRIAVSASNRISENYRDNNDSTNQRLSIRGNRIDNGITSYIEFESVNDDIQTPGALLEAERDEDRSQSLSFYGDDYFETETQMIRLGMEKIIDDSRTISVDFSTRETDREFIQTFRPFPGSVTTQDRESHDLSASYKVVPVEAQSLTSYLIGFDHEDTDYELVSTFGPQAMDQTIQGIFVSTQWSIGDQSQLDAGIRYSDQQAEIAGDDFDDSVSVFNIGYSHRIDQLKLFARADQNFRYATVEEHTNVPFGDEPGLKTQEGISVEFGAELQKGADRYRGTLYQISLDNEIAFDSSGFSNLNLDKTERTGIILEIANRWSEKFSSRISLTSLDAEITDGSFKGNNLPLVPEQTIRLDGSYQYDQATLISLEVVTVDDQTFGGDFANQLDQLSGYQVVNTHITYHQKNWSLGFRINNLFDEEYAETGSQFTEFDPVTFAPTNFESFFPAPERNAWVNLKIKF